MPKEPWCLIPSIVGCKVVFSFISAHISFDFLSRPLCWSSVDRLLDQVNRWILVKESKVGMTILKILLLNPGDIWRETRDLQGLSCGGIRGLRAQSPQVQRNASQIIIKNVILQDSCHKPTAPSCLSIGNQTPTMDPSAAHTTCTSDAITACAQPPEPTESEPSPIPPSPKEGQMSPEQRTLDDDGGSQPSEEDFRKQKLLEANSKDNYGYRRIIRNFTPS